MRFEVTQQFSADPDAVAAAYCDPAFYALLRGLPKLGDTELLDRTETGDRVQLRVRYRFTGELSPAVTAVVDPAKLTWVDVSEHDLTTRRVRFRLEPDNYADRLSCQGSYRFEAAGTGCRRIADGDLKVHVLLVGAKVEKAIVSGLREHLDAETPLMERFLAGR